MSVAMTCLAMAQAASHSHNDGMTPPIFRSPAVFRTVMNVWPPYWGTGISVAEVSPDWRRMVVRMKQRFYNGNAFGTHFGGSLYAMCDPYYALMLIRLLGPDYVVWDKAAAIEFVKPGRGTVQAVFDWQPAQLEEIRARTADGAKFEPQRCVEVADAAGDVVARVHKTLYVRRKQAA
jgi:acyl-coenzyme A thioesterase PaaI-like protein